ncbi:MAG: hypothetical protein WDW36_000469 [Sanguina aurantia]
MDIDSPFEQGVINIASTDHAAMPGGASSLRTPAAANSSNGSATPIYKDGTLMHPAPTLGVQVIWDVDLRRGRFSDASDAPSEADVRFFSPDFRMHPAAAALLPQTLSPPNPSPPPRLPQGATPCSMLTQP